MSEAVEGTTLINSYGEPQSRLRFTSDPLLSESLQRFIRHTDDLDTTVGQEGPFLFADNSIATDGRYNGGVTRRGGTESAAVAALGMVIRQRRSQFRHLGKKLQVAQLPEQHPGIVIKLDVIMDELTALALRGHMAVHPDRSVGVHVTIRREQLVSRPEYMAACHRLYEQLLGDGRRPGIRAIDLIRQAPKP